MKSLAAIEALIPQVPLDENKSFDSPRPNIHIPKMETMMVAVRGFTPDSDLECAIELDFELIVGLETEHGSLSA